MLESKRIAMVVLAAGASSRLGRPKQNLEFGGKTLLQTTVDAILETGRSGVIFGAQCETFVILGANEKVIRAKNNLAGCTVLTNNAWAEGLSSSIRCALKHLENGGETLYDAALFTVADLAHVEADHFLKLLQAYARSDAPVVCSSFKAPGKTHELVYGVPSVFARALFPQLMQLSGDMGAKKIINNYAHQLVSIEMSDAAFDIDTEADLMRLRSSI